MHKDVSWNIPYGPSFLLCVFGKLWDRVVKRSGNCMLSYSIIIRHLDTGGIWMKLCLRSSHTREHHSRWCVSVYKCADLLCKIGLLYTFLVQIGIFETITHRKNEDCDRLMFTLLTCSKLWWVTRLFWALVRVGVFSKISAFMEVLLIRNRPLQNF